MPKLRGNPDLKLGPWNIGAIPDNVILILGAQIVHRLSIGQIDITGNDFGTIFANAAKGEHRASPLGVADVVANGTAWSVKTVKHPSPHEVKVVRLISGRNSPDYSVGISDPRENAEATGKAVLDVWNARVNESSISHDELRGLVFIRNMDTKNFCIFEQPITIFPADDFDWKFNNNGNLEGFEKSSGQHFFTWQPHGSQFTIKCSVPGSARRFFINRDVPIVSQDEVLYSINYKHSWISIL